MCAPVPRQTEGGRLLERGNLKSLGNSKIPSQFFNQYESCPNWQFLVCPTVSIRRHTVLIKHDQISKCLVYAYHTQSCNHDS